MSLQKKLRYWGIALIGLGVIAAPLITPLIQLLSQPRWNQDPLAPTIAYYALSIIGHVGVPLGAGFVAVSFVTSLIREAKASPDEE